MQFKIKKVENLYFSTFLPFIHRYLNFMRNHWLRSMVAILLILLSISFTTLFGSYSEPILV